MPQLRNHTPFPAILYESLDRADAAFHTLALRATLDLTRGGALAAQQDPLCLGDLHHGDPAESSTRWESDLCPRKPATDVIVHAVARALNGVARPSWEVSLSVGALQKRLRVTGPRWWERGGDEVWRLSDPLPTAAVPLRYELAYGGGVGDELYPGNPVGVGHAPPSRLARERRIAAAQVESPDAPVARVDEALAPQGFGPIGRAWSPRRERAGTFDAAWLDTRWPAMPDDFNDGYWNGAHPDLVIPGFLRGGEGVSLSGVHPQGTIEFALPSAYVYALGRYHNGVMLPLPMVLDTLLIDVETMTAGLVYRVSFEQSPPMRVVEARADFTEVRRG